MSDTFPIPGLELATPAPGVRARRRGPAGGPQRAPAGRRRPRRCAAARRRRRRVGQDPGAHPADRVADLAAPGPSRLDPGHHLHQQGRGRDAERVEELVGRRARIMWVSTFHSACVRILRKEIGQLGWKSNFSIYDAADSKRLMTLVLPRPRRRPAALPAGRGAQLGLGPEERAARPRGGRPRTPATPSRRPAPRRTPSTSAGCARPTRSTSTT